jgi:hypothetical protein
MPTIVELKLLQEQIHTEFIDAVSAGKTNAQLRVIQEKMRDVIKEIYILEQKLL